MNQGWLELTQQHFLSALFIPGAVLVSRNKAVNITDKNPSPCGTYILSMNQKAKGKEQVER